MPTLTSVLFKTDHRHNSPPITSRFTHGQAVMAGIDLLESVMVMLPPAGGFRAGGAIGTRVQRSRPLAGTPLI
jgi:hypothetical protein